MDNIKMGEIIREARKKKGLTQKDIATHLHITDRAVSKWERGVCTPDLAVLEPLAEMLDISVAELITGKVEVVVENKEDVELVVKETIEYSKQENDQKKRKSRKRTLLLIFTLLFLFGALLLYLLHLGFFHKIGKYPSPDGTTVTTVYNCNLNRNGLPTYDGFTVESKGYWNGRTTYMNSTFKGMWWSPSGAYRVVSMYDSDNKTYMELVDYTRNAGCNLNAYLEIAIWENEFFSNVPINEEGYPDIHFEFIQWSTEDPAVLLVYFSYDDAYGNFHEGYTWYDYESGLLSGEMELEQGEKDLFWLNQMWIDIN